MNIRPYLIRLAIIGAISVVFAALFNEATFALQKEPTDRGPKTVQVVIPPGTAERIESGDAEPFLPEELVFVIGDVLEVVNQDSVSHQLGPIWVPAGSTASLVMNQVEQVRYSCSFQSQQYLGLDIKQPVTFTMRMTGLLLTVPTLGALLFLYSLAAYPIDRQKNSTRTRETA